MNVLSLFDGISCGMIALERAGIKVDKYYASEINENSIKISKRNYPNIIQLGDVRNWDKWDIEWKDIDLVIGGSPCQNVSSSGNRKGLDGEKSSLYYYYRFILNMIKKFNPDVKFLLENVRMKNEYKNKISEDLGVKPMLINSNLVSAQNRNRLYWFNWECDYPEDKNIIVRSILETKGVVKERVRLYHSDNVFIGLELTKSFCIQKRYYKGVSRYRKEYCAVQMPDGSYRPFTPVELERLQTLPDNYTEGICRTKRGELIGDGWTVDVVAHILKHLKLE